MANIATHASAAMNAAHASANAAAAGSKQSEGQAKNATEDGDEHNPASQFMEAIRNVLSAFGKIFFQSPFLRYNSCNSLFCSSSNSNTIT